MVSIPFQVLANASVADQRSRGMCCSLGMDDWNRVSEWIDKERIGPDEVGGGELTVLSASGVASWSLMD